MRAHLGSKVSNAYEYINGLLPNTSKMDGICLLNSKPDPVSDKINMMTVSIPMKHQKLSSAGPAIELSVTIPEDEQVHMHILPFVE